VRTKIGVIPIVIKCCALHKERRAIPKLRLRLPPVVKPTILEHARIGAIAPLSFDEKKCE